MNMDYQNFLNQIAYRPKGLIIHSLSNIASHWSCEKTLDDWLYEEKIPGIYGIDTRELTKILRG